MDVDLFAFPILRMHAFQLQKALKVRNDFIVRSVYDPPASCRPHALSMQKGEPKTKYKLPLLHPTGGHMVQKLLSATHTLI